MGYSKKTGFKRIAIFIVALIFGLTLLFGAASTYLSSKAETRAAEGLFDQNSAVQPNKEIPEGQPGNTNFLAKYMTFSQANNIDIIVNYTSPVNKDKDTLTFDITIDTHSVDLTKYVDIRKFVELRTDAGIKISNGFEWDLESGEGHHIGGVLKIKNDIDGKPIVDSDTKSFKLVFKNIGDTGETEHVYEGDMLK